MGCEKPLRLVWVAWILLLGNRCNSTPACAPAGPSCGNVAESAEHGPDDDVALLQTKVSNLRSSARQPEDTQEASCHEMVNAGSYFTVKVQVGTPTQTFDIVADTGSNAFVLTDCKCLSKGQCSNWDTCFATGNSTSFKLNQVSSSRHSKKSIISYGSGSIITKVASDHVTLGSVAAFLQDGVFLIEEKMNLDIMTSNFQGILGLGLPGADLGLKSPIFMEKAGVQRYSMCFNDEDPGIMRINIPKLENAMSNLGEVHWGLDLQGMSVGNKSANVLLSCDPSAKKAGQQTACAAIPDSGTTLMLGPEDHIHALYEALCTEWPRCSALAQKRSTLPKHKAFVQLLTACDDWMDSTPDGIDEVPPIMLHVAGSDGRPQRVRLSAWAYVVAYEQDAKEIANPGKPKYKCKTSIDAQKYDTVMNGQVWILGSPLFFDNIVSYDIGAAPAKIAINPGECASCKANLLETEIPPRRWRRQQLRWLHGVRKSSVNVNRRL